MVKKFRENGKFWSMDQYTGIHHNSDNGILSVVVSSVDALCYNRRGSDVWNLWNRCMLENDDLKACLEWVWLELEWCFLCAAKQFSTVISNRWKKIFLYHFTDFRVHSVKLICISIWSTVPKPMMQTGFRATLQVVVCLSMSTESGVRIVESIQTSFSSLHLKANKPSGWIYQLESRSSWLDRLG